MASPASQNKTFRIENIPLRQFFSLGSQAGNRGVLHTAFIAKQPSSNEFTLQAPSQINGFCSYSFMMSMGVICGFLVMSPVATTLVKHTALVIGTESEEYKPLYNLQPQGVIIMESSDSNLVFLSLHVDSPLLVKVDV